MNIEELKLYTQEQHILMMRIIKIVEYSNLQDLKTINSILVENGFVTKEDLKEETIYREQGFTKAKTCPTCNIDLDEEV
jgi:hypothetical protein